MLKLLKYLKPYSLSVFFILIFVFLQMVSQLYLPTLLANIVNIGIVKNNMDYILKTGGLMLVISLLGALFTILSSYLSAKTGTGFSKIIRNRVFTKIEGFSLHEIDQLGTASLITRTTNDIEQIERVVIMMLRMMVTAPMMAIGGIIMALSKDIKLSLILIVILPLLGITVYYISRKVIPLFKLMQKKMDNVNRIIREYLTGIRVIRAFSRESHEKKRFDQANHELTDNAILLNKIMAVIMPLAMLIMNFSIIAVVWFGSIRIDNNSMQIGDLMAFIQYIMQILFSFLMVSMIFVMLPRASASAERINEILETEESIKDPENIENIGENRGYLEFRNVSFSYFGAEEPALSNISFKAKPGEVTAIIGSTGAGKSTLVNLIPRFYDVDQGSIMIDGVDIRKLPQKELRSRIGFVPQKAVLFSGTIAENIRIGNKNALDKEVKHAAGIAQAIEFISSYKDGFNTNIEQGGVNISGGQKQRLSISRALIKKPEIFIFDDSFSALDFKTDARLRAALKKVIHDSTLIIVAQRVSSIINSDQIIVLNEGKIAAIGKHQELLNKSQIYRQIVFSQLSEEELA
jgi:ATP-binding cassette, subfamily B, multidrug efflux pump